MEDTIILRRTSPKPYPTKGIYAPYKSPATRASIGKNTQGFYEVNVWDMNKSGYPWSEWSYSMLHKFVRLDSLEEAKHWLIENYGGKWCKI